MITRHHQLLPAPLFNFPLRGKGLTGFQAFARLRFIIRPASLPRLQLEFAGSLAGGSFTRLGIV